MSSIEKSLLSRLTAAAPGAAINASLVKWENLNPGGKTFVPPQTGLWYRAWFIAGEPTAAALGSEAKNRHVGIFQLDILCAPAGQGTKTVDDEAERIRKIFARGTVLSSDGQIVVVKKSWVVRPQQDEPAYFKQIVRVAWTADVAN